MASKYIININGKIGDENDSKISVLDKGFLYGDSVYDVTYLKDSKLIFLEEHLDRLWNSASLLDIEISFSREYLKEQINKTLSHTNFAITYIRFIVTRGEGDIDLSSSPKNTNLIIITKELPPNPERLYTQGISLYLGDRLRNDRKATDPNAKSGNYLNSVMAMREAKAKGFEDALLKNSKGFIAEGTTFNIWYIKDNIIRTPHEDCGLLEGITREKILSLNEDSFNIQKAYITPEQLLDADTVFISSTTKGIMPVKNINTTTLTHDCELLEELIKAYKKLTNT